MDARSMKRIMALPAIFYLASCIFAAAWQAIEAGFDPATLLGFPVMILFGWISMIAAISGDSSLGDSRSMLWCMALAAVASPLLLRWLQNVEDKHGKLPFIWWS